MQAQRFSVARFTTGSLVAHYRLVSHLCPDDGPCLWTQLILTLRPLLYKIVDRLKIKKMWAGWSGVVVVVVVGGGEWGVGGVCAGVTAHLYEQKLQ